MSEVVGRDECERMQEACAGRILDKLGSIETAIHRIETNMQDILDRLKALETWKAKLNGAAEEAAKHSLGRRTYDNRGFWQKNWLLITAIVLGTMAGERVIPFIFKILGFIK